MTALYLTIFISLLLAILFLIFFIQNVRSGQYDDAYAPSVRMLFEDDEPVATEKDEINETDK